MSKVGLVLGGGGITGACYHFGVLLGIKMATGWDPGNAEVVVGTSAGAAVAAVVRTTELSIDGLIGTTEGPENLTEKLRRQLYPRRRPGGLVRWARHGLVPGLRRPGLSLLLGSPAPFHTGGIEEWLEERIGDAAHRWPDRVTVISAYDLEARHRVAFGTDESPDVALHQAVAASTAVPMIFEPVEIGGRYYIDGGVASGTSIDLVLGSNQLDLVIVIAPMAAALPRKGAPFYEKMLDNAGHQALEAELARLRSEWPDTDVLVLRPDSQVMKRLRPNPLSVEAVVPSFLGTLRSLRDELGAPDVWNVLERHLLQADHPVAG